VGSFTDLDVVPIDEELEACSGAYKKLRSNTFCFNDLHIKQNQTRRMSITKISRTAI